MFRLRTGLWLVCAVVMALLLLEVNAFNQIPPFFNNPGYGVFPFIPTGFYPAGGFDVIWNVVRVGTPVYGWTSLAWPVGG